MLERGRNDLPTWRLDIFDEQGELVGWSGPHGRYALHSEITRFCAAGWVWPVQYAAIP